VLDGRNLVCGATPRLKIWPCYETQACAAGQDWSILWYDISSGKGTWDLVPGMLGACIGQVHLQQQPGN